VDPIAWRAWQDTYQARRYNTYVPKLTLSIDKSVVSRAKRYAQRRGTSVSKLVEAYLDVVSEPVRASKEPPILRSLRGTLQKADPAAYKEHLTKKYR
jgi:hypothetical protein